VRQSDVVDGHPTEFGRFRDDLLKKEKDKEAERKQAGGDGGGETESPMGNEGERRVPSASEHGFHEWEKEEMEALLQEVRGTLGKSCSWRTLSWSMLIGSHVLDAIPRSRGLGKQFLVQRKLSFFL
jgi:hypothetical protein